jgi:hypothetical protein
MIKKCITCGADIATTKNYCSNKCYNKHYAVVNAEKLKKQKAEFHQKHKEEIGAKVKAWRIANPGMANAYNRAYKKRKRSGNKSNMSVNDRLKHLVRTRIHDALNGRNKPTSVIKNLGCSIEELKRHIESKFYPHPNTGTLMTWDNLGKARSCDAIVWQIDHIEALHTFDLSNVEEFKRAINFKNLQPLWYSDHVVKTAEELKSRKIPTRG